jgi:hypothetical protein
MPRNEMGHANRTEPVALVCLLGLRRDERPTDHVARHTKSQHGRSVDPMERTHGQFPHVQSAVRWGRDVDGGTSTS